MIGVVTTSYPRWRGDAAGNFVDGHARALLALGHPVEVIAAGPPVGSASPPGHPLTVDALVTRIPSSLFYRGGAPELLERAPVASTLAAASFTLRLAAAVRRRRWDHVIAHWLAPSAIACLPARTPLLAIAHGGDVHTLRRLHLLAPVLHALRARRAKLVFVAEELRRISREAAPALARWLDDAIVQPMGVDVARFAALTRAPVHVLVAARLVPIKGVDVAIDAMTRLPDTRLVIAGDGPERAALAHRAPSNVTFVGEVDAAARDRLLAAASVVVVPSRVLANGRSEGTPTIALEALAAGVPVIASAVGGLGDLPTRLVPPDDPEALATAIRNALSRREAAPPPPADWQTVARRLLAHSQVSKHHDGRA
jgi:glycosyltransferase involved in cell wall biosynthesis